MGTVLGVGDEAVAVAVHGREVEAGVGAGLGRADLAVDIGVEPAEHLARSHLGMRLRMRGALDLGIDRGLWLLRVLHFSAIVRRRSLPLHRPGRKSVVEGKRGSVRVGLGGRRYIKKKK